MTNDPVESLEVNDPRRQAIPPLRGYDYQIWQSLNRWVSLGVGEVLFLEVAEDFDVLRGEEAETVQVKETSRGGAITLNSKSVIDAIAHFWEHQNNNPGYTVRFRLLTISERGVEQPNPFAGVRGLDYWDQCKRFGINIDPMRLFLISRENLPTDLTAFVASASDDELRENLIRRIEWDTGQKDKAYVEELVTQKVVYYGTHNLALSHSESVKVVSHLFKHVWSVILQAENRRLTYGDFTRLAEEYSTVRIPKRALQLRAESLGVMPDLGLGMTAGVQSFDLITETSPESYAQPSFDRLAVRETLVADLTIRLNGKGIIALKGSSGMGKSTLAALVTAKDKGRWRRLDLRDLKPEQIKGHLLYASMADSEPSGHSDYVIDDLNFYDHPSLYERALAGFIHTVTARGGRIIITTQGDVPERILLAFDLPSDVVINVPRLTEEEVGQVAFNYGCPAGKNLEMWRRVIHGNTLGHPLLVHARIKNVASAGWPAPRIDDLFKPEGVESVRGEIRKSLRDQLPSEQARTLAYRLSIFTGYFKRNHALHLAQHPPALTSSGEAFDLLVGPWVERLEHGYHRLSPLLTGSAQQMFSEGDVKNLHKTAAYAFLTQKTLTPTEVNGALFHGLMGEIAEPLIAVATTTLSIESKDWPVISREIDWLASIALKPGSKLFKPEPFTSMSLRMIQFKVAAEIDSSGKAPKVVASWEAELDSFDEYKEFPFYFALRMLGQFLFNQVIFRYEVPVPIRTVVNSIIKTVIFDRECQAAAASGDRVMQGILRERPKVVSEFDTEVFVAVWRCKTADDVAEFFDALEAADADAAEVFWAELRNDESVAMNLISAAWLKEINEPSPDWPRAMVVIERAAVIALARRADALFAHAYCAKAIIIREYLPERDSDRARTVLAEAAGKLGYEHPVLQDYLAKVYMLDGRYHDALEVWRNIPTEPETTETRTRLFTYHEALICAGKLGDWSLAAEYALEGEKIAHRLIQAGDVVAVGFLAEHAFAVWKSGDFQKALLSFSGLIDALGTLPDTNKNIRSYALHVSVLHAIRWMGQDYEGLASLAEPQAGDFTLTSVDEKVRNKPVPPYAFYWLHLAWVEYRRGEGDSVFRRFEEECKGLDVAAVKFQLEHLRLLHFLRKANLTSLISKYAVYADIMKSCVSAAGLAPTPASSETQLLISLLFAALVKLVSLGAHRDAPVKLWATDARAKGVLDTALAAWLDLVERSISADEDELLRIMKDPAQPPEARPVPALILSASSHLDPEDRFTANSVLINAAHSYSSWGQEIEPVVEKVMVDGWVSTVAGQRFALRSPWTNAPKILEACHDDTARGLRKAARILLAAREAVSIGLPKDLLIKLKSMAEMDAVG